MWRMAHFKETNKNRYGNEVVARVEKLISRNDFVNDFQSTMLQSVERQISNQRETERLTGWRVTFSYDDKESREYGMTIEEIGKLRSKYSIDVPPVTLTFRFVTKIIIREIDYRGSKISRTKLKTTIG